MHLADLKPAAPARVHLLAAAALWTVVGVLLGAFGTRWLVTGAGRQAAWLLPLAAGLGVLKAVLVLRRTAARAAERIRQRGDGRCIGGFLSWRSWAFVLAMMVLGSTLRGGLLPRPVVGCVYVAVGVALFLGSVPLWKAWRRSLA
jgi:hypothetical protein